MKRAIPWLLTALCLVLAAVPAPAHEVRPAYLALTERVKGEFDVVWKVPAMGGTPLAGEEIPHGPELGRPAPPAGTPTTVSMPCGCPAPTAAQLSRGVLPIHPSMPPGAVTISSPTIERLFGAEIKRWTIRTGKEGLEGWEVAMHGLSATMVDVLVRIQLLDGMVISQLIRPDAPSFVFHAGKAGPAVSAYFMLGIEHILLGIDHLLFVLALMLIVRGSTRLLQTITAFTISHSITLALATLGVVNVPSAPVETSTALSIVFIAVEVVRSRRGQVGLTERAPWLVAGAFGLLHGLGFAGALQEIGLPQGDIPMALLLFNLGVEAGQLVFIAVVLVLSSPARQRAHLFPPWIQMVPPYALGSLAMFWALERASALW